MSAKIVFLDRDGTIVEEPEDGRVDALGKIRLIPDVIPALRRFVSAGYELVIVTNQEGLGTPAFPAETFGESQTFIESLFASQGIEFLDVLICPHYEADRCGCRKPAPGLVADYLVASRLDRDASIVIGDRATDLELARNIGLRGFRVGADGRTWSEIAHIVLDQPRVASIARKTRETDIRIDIDLDAAADPEISTGLAFFDHMLEQLGKHGGFSLRVECNGDLEVDEHHTIEDVALCLGRAFRDALGEKRGIARYGFLLPMDEAEAEIAVDLGGRAYLVFDGAFPRDDVGGMPTELVPHFFRSLADTLGAAIHIRVRGENTHHMIEACFKGVARALGQAFARRGEDLPSTKGSL
jgi:imidazoleglycerol-phosphate dehydratase/histidinol-phosphatase